MQTNLHRLRLGLPALAAVGLAANYHASMIVMFKGQIEIGEENLDTEEKREYVSTRQNPLYAFVEDGGGVRIFNRTQLEIKMREFYSGGIQYYDGRRNIGGRTTSSAEKGMQAYIYQLFPN